jgi:iron complex transport system permease protein
VTQPSAVALHDDARHRGRRLTGTGVRIALLAVAVAALTLVSFGFGRFPVDPLTVVKILVSRVVNIPVTWPAIDQTVVLHLRLPRILAALLVGAALASSGAAYQTMFRNPLVSPEILGVANGAGFGASLGILLGASQAELQLLAFVGGLLAAAAALAIARIVASISPIVLVLGGIVIGAMFGALISGAQYVANPETTLPVITFWLFGSLARATTGGLLVPAIIVGVCLIALYALRWQLTVLATGEDEARTLGISRRLVWSVVITASTLMTATVVSVAGIIGWVGLVVPHMGRALVGPSFGRLLAVSTMLGAGYLLGVDDVARSVTSIDIPLGILSALIGVPVFVAVLVRSGRQWL